MAIQFAEFTVINSKIWTKPTYHNISFEFRIEFDFHVFCNSWISRKQPYSTDPLHFHVFFLFSFLTAISFAIAVHGMAPILWFSLLSVLLSIVEYYSAVLCHALSFAVLSALSCAQLCRALSFALLSALRKQCWAVKALPKLGSVSKAEKRYSNEQQQPSWAALTSPSWAALVKLSSVKLSSWAALVFQSLAT